MIFGIPTLIENENLEESFELCSGLRLNFIELNMNMPQYQVESLSKTDLLINLKDKYHIGYTIHLDENLNVCDFNKSVADAYMETVKKTIHIAKEIDAPVINMHLNHGVHFTLPDKKVQLFEMYNQFYMDRIKAFRNMCENEIGTAKIKICIENTDGYKNYERRAVKYLLESEAFALTWDIGHCNSAGNVDEEFILQNEEHLAHFHIHDSLGNKDHMTLGTGEIDLEKRLSAAKRHNCRCVIETKTVQALKKSVGWLRVNGYM